MKKRIVGLLGLVALLFLGYGTTFAQSIPTIGSNMTTTVISQPYTEAQCIEPGNVTVYVNRHFYLGDSYTTTDLVPKWGNGYDTLLLNATKVFIYNPALFNFTSTIQYKSNGIPNNSPVASAVVSQGTFTVNSTLPGQLVYNIHRTALENAGSSSYSLSYLGRPNLVNYTAQLNNKTFHNTYGTRVRDGFECVNYTVHYCGDGVIDTQQSISNLNIAAGGTFTTSIANEQCDGTAGVPAGYTCTASCTLQTTVVKPTCTLSVAPGAIQLGNSTQAVWDITGNYTNTPQITYTPTTRNITGLPYNVPTANGQRTITPIHTGAYTLSMTVSNSAGSSTCTAPLTVNYTPPPQNLSCVLTVNPNPSSPNQIVSVGWQVTGGNFFGTYIYVTPTVGGAWPHWVNANQYSGITSILPTQAGDHIFTMMVSNNQSSAICTGVLHVIANPPPTCILTTTTPTIVSGQTAILSGSYTNATSATMTPTIAGLNFIYPNRSKNNISVHPIVTTTYILTVNGLSGTTPAICQKTITVANNPPPTCTLTTTTPTIVSGQTAILSGSYTNASLAMITPNIFGLNFTYPNRSKNNISVHPIVTTTYTLTVLGSGGCPSVVCNVTVNVTAPSVNFNKILLDDILYYSGDLVSFKINFSNNGPTILHNVVIDDRLPPSLTYVSSQIYGVAQYTFGTGVNGLSESFQYSGFNLVPGQAGYIILTGKFIGQHPNSTQNNAFFTATEIPTIMSSAVFRVYTPTANAIITKTVDRTSYYPGENARFTIAVTNNGPDAINHVQIIDTWPNTSCLTLDTLWASSIPSMTISSTTNPYVWDFNMILPAGQTVYLYLTGHITNSSSCIGSYINKVDLRYRVNGQTKTGHAEATINVIAPPFAGNCRALDALDGSIALVDGNHNAESRFRCSTVNDATASSITIDCGNGTHYTQNNVSTIETTCHYTNVSPLPREYPVSCVVDNALPTPLACQQTLIVDESSLGYCGNGIREGYEKCDDGNTNNNDGCTNGCDIPGSSLVGCFNVGNTSISIQKGEILPFRWTLDNTGNIIPGDTCDGKPDGSIPKESIWCTFNIYNGDHTEANEDPVNQTPFKRKCREDQWLGRPIFEYFLDKQDERWSLKHAFGKYYKNTNEFVDDIFGEYKISLDKVEYQYCNSDDSNEGTHMDRLCSVDFAVTQPYLAQKNSFGLTPKATSIPLDGYKMLDGTDIINNTDLSDIMVLQESVYDGGNTIPTMMDKFINKYTKLAVKYETVENGTITASKVPGQDIVVFKGAGTLNYIETSIAAKNKPFTVIVDGPDLKINGSIKNTNAMFLVNQGDITFVPTIPSACDQTEIVKGIFVTNQGRFKASPDVLTNNNLNRGWCNYGGLRVQGILIGDGIENLVDSRRSHLNGWFYVGGSSLASIKAERRNEIFNGASVLIEYSPSLWGALPPGASEFTKALDIYKQ